MVKVLFVNNTAGEVNISHLNEMIKNNKIAAYCGPNGWVVVENHVDAGVILGINREERKKEPE